MFFFLIWVPSWKQNEDDAQLEICKSRNKPTFYSNLRDKSCLTPNSNIMAICLINSRQWQRVRQRDESIPSNTRSEANKSFSNETFVLQVRWIFLNRREFNLIPAMEEKKQYSALTIDRAAFLLLRVKKAFKKKKLQRKERERRYVSFLI